MDFRTKVEDVFYSVKDKIEDIFLDLKEKRESKSSEPDGEKSKKNILAGIDKRKLIAIAVLIVFLIGLVACVAAKHGGKSSGGKKKNGANAEEVGTTDDSDAWWKKYMGADASMPGYAPTKANELKWDPVDGAIGYNVYRATKKDGEYVCIAVVEKPEYIDTTAENGKKYFYKTTAIKVTKTEKKDGTTKLVTREVTIAPESIVTEKVTVYVPTGTTEKDQKPIEIVTDKDGEVVTNKEGEIVTKEVGGDESETTDKKDEDKTTEDESKDDTTEPVTEPPTEPPTVPPTEPPTKKPPVSAPKTSTNNSTINNSRNAFENKLAGTDGESTALRDIAVACSRSAGNGGTVTKITSGRNVLGQKTTVNGFDECYRFTAAPSVYALGRHVAGYVFKVTSISAEDFANSLYNNTKTSESFTGVGSSNIRYKNIDYYGDYVFYMIATY